jgi:hypothetical protein
MSTLVNLTVHLPPHWPEGLLKEGTQINKDVHTLEARRASLEAERVAILTRLQNGESETPEDELERLRGICVAARPALMVEELRIIKRRDGLIDGARKADEEEKKRLTVLAEERRDELEEKYCELPPRALREVIAQDVQMHELRNLRLSTDSVTGIIGPRDYTGAPEVRQRCKELQEALLRFG